MTPEQRVAAALSQMEHEDICMSEPPLPDHEAGDMYRPCSLGAMRLKAATPAGQALAADLALADAVRRLGDTWRIDRHVFDGAAGAKMSENVDTTPSKQARAASECHYHRTSGVSAFCKNCGRTR